MGVGLAVREAWTRVRGVSAAKADGARKTASDGAGGLAFLTPFVGPATRPSPSPRATPINLRRFAETPVARRAINCIKDRIACLEWDVVACPAAGASAADTSGDRAESGTQDITVRLGTLRASLTAPNAADSFRTLIEQVLDDILVLGNGAVEVETTGNDALPVRLYPVDASTIEVNVAWSGDADDPRYEQRTTRRGSAAETPLLDRELMFVRLNTRTHSPFGLGKLEVAFETIARFMEAQRYAGKLAGNSVTQVALWTPDRTPEQHERLVRWWEEDVEGSGRVPVLSCPEKPEVLRFAAGTDADLRLSWQEFLLRMIANAFDIPALVLGEAHDVNRSTASDVNDEMFRTAIIPLARLIADHITRDVFAKALGMRDVAFVWKGLESRDEVKEVNILVQLLSAGVMTVDEARAQRGLPALPAAAASGTQDDEANQEVAKEEKKVRAR